MITFITVVYVLVCVFLILVVLLQAGRGGGMGAAMGGSSQTVFGGAGAGNFLQRLTVISASLFMILSALLAYLSSSGEQALERADERIRVREEARMGETKGKTDKAAAEVVDAGLSVLPALETPELLQNPAEDSVPAAAEAPAEAATQDAIAEEAPSAEPAAEAPKRLGKKAVPKKLAPPAAETAEGAPAAPAEAAPAAAPEATPAAQ